MSLDMRRVGRDSDLGACPYCNGILLGPDDFEESEPESYTAACEHVWGYFDDLGVSWLSEAAMNQLTAAGVTVSHDPDQGIQLRGPSTEGPGDHEDHVDLLARTFHGPGAVVLTVYASAPSLLGTYIGVSEAAL